MTDPLNERMDRFYAETGVWPPSRDRPAAMGGEREPEAWDVWKVWCRKDALQLALSRLAQAEHDYRLVHDSQGDGHPQTGRAWDHLRQSGNEARELLAAMHRKVGTA